MDLDNLEERPLSTVIIEEVTYGDSTHVVMPWSCLSARNSRALHKVLEDQELEAGIELGFTIAGQNCGHVELETLSGLVKYHGVVLV